MAVTVEVIGTHSSPVTMYAVAPGRTIPDSEEAWKKAILEAGIRAEEAAISAAAASQAAENASQSAEEAAAAAGTAAEEAAQEAAETVLSTFGLQATLISGSDYSLTVSAPDNE